MIRAYKPDIGVMTADPDANWVRREDLESALVEIEQLRDAMIRAQKETGTSTSTWHVLEDALRGTTKDTPPYKVYQCAFCGWCAKGKDAADAHACEGLLSYRRKVSEKNND